MRLLVRPLQHRRNYVYLGLSGTPIVPLQSDRGGGDLLVLDWETDVFPVLRATYQAWEVETQGGTLPQVAGASGIEINRILGRDDDDLRTALVLGKLIEGDYVRLAFAPSMTGRHCPDDCQVTEKGLRLVAGWPGTAEDAMVSRLLSVVEERIAAAPTAAERGAWVRIRDGLREIPQQVVVEVLTKVLTGGL